MNRVIFVSLFAVLALIQTSFAVGEGVNGFYQNDDGVKGVYSPEGVSGFQSDEGGKGFQDDEGVKGICRSDDGVRG